MGEAPSTGLSASLASAGFALGRLQTGTPARLDKNTIDFLGLERQDGDQHPLPFSFLNKAVDNAVGTLHWNIGRETNEGLGQSSCMFQDCDNA